MWYLLRSDSTPQSADQRYAWLSRRPRARTGRVPTTCRAPSSARRSRCTSPAASTSLQRAGSNSADSQSGATVASSGNTTSSESCARTCSASPAHASASAFGSCGSSQTVTRMRLLLPDPHARARLEVEPLARHDAERVVPHVEVPHRADPQRLRRRRRGLREQRDVRNRTEEKQRRRRDERAAPCRVEADARHGGVSAEVMPSPTGTSISFAKLPAPPYIVAPGSDKVRSLSDMGSACSRAPI